MTRVVAGPVPRPEWTPVARAGCHGVEAKWLLDLSALSIALLRFSKESTIDEHSAPHAVDVICLEGAGMFSVDGDTGVLRAGESVRWPSMRAHRLWTEESSMMTLMVEHLSG